MKNFNNPFLSFYVENMINSIKEELRKVLNKPNFKFNPNSKDLDRIRKGFELEENVKDVIQEIIASHIEVKYH